MSLSDDDSDICDSLDYLPKKLQKHLMPFQKRGVQFGIEKQGRCLIADEMGLGKTLQALCIASHYHSEWPVLIVVPSSLRYPWLEEIEKWFPDIAPESLNLIESCSDIEEIPTARVSIVTFGLLRHPASKIVQEALYNQNFKVIIVDESHYMKSRSSATTKYLVPLLQKAKRKILLTGTPALNRPEELFPQLDAIEPGLLGTWSQFSKRYCDARWLYFGKQRRWVTDGAVNLEELQSVLSDSVMIRRLKKDVLKQLPPKQRQRIAFRLKESDIKKELDKIGDSLEKLLSSGRKRFVDVLASGDRRCNDNWAANASGNAATLNDVYKLLSEFYMKTCSAKLGPVKEYVKMLGENKDLKFIIFAYHRIMLDSITEQLIDDKVNFIRIDGSTVAADRPLLVKRFQSDAKTRVAVLSIKAAGVGLTLTAASLVVFAELDWTPGTLEQCEDRAHRIGQNDTVHVHYLVAAGTLDEWVWSALAKKTKVVTTALNGKKQLLKMDDGTSEQVELLSSADAYLPSTDLQTNVAAILQQSEMKAAGQKSVRDYFASGADHNQNIADVTEKDKLVPDSTGKWRLQDGNSTPVRRKPCTSSSPGSAKRIITIDSGSDGDEENQFRTPKIPRLSVFPSSGKSGSGKLQNQLRRKTPSAVGKKLDKFLASTENVEKSSEWSCVACTFINHPLIVSCEMCLTPRSQQSVSLSPGVASVIPQDCCSDKVLPKFPSKVSSSPGVDSGFGSQDFGTAGFPCENHTDGIPANATVSCGIAESGSAEWGAGRLVFTPVRVSNSASRSAHTISDNESDCDSPVVALRTPASTTTDKLNESATCSPSESVDGEAESFDLQHSFDDECENELNETGGGIHSTSIQTSDFSSSECGQSTNEDLNENGNDAIDVGNVVVHSSFQFLCSRHTSRIYLYDKNGKPLNLNFSPLDLQLENFSEFPDILLHPHHLQLLKRFLREWNSLSPTKRRMIIRSGIIFANPVFLYEQLRSAGKTSCNQRYISKADIAAEALSKAQSVGGTVRVIARTAESASTSADLDGILQDVDSNGLNCPVEELMETLSGFVQAVDADGNPLCLQCHSVFSTTLVTKSTVAQNPWQTRLCSRQCAQKFWMSRHRGYGARQVYEAEHGVCQLCQFDAEGFYQRLKMITNLEKRVRMLEDSIYKVLKAEVKERMIRQPCAGLFWNVDHITAVADGGGQCDVGNLRTLCTVCHRDVTARQHKERSRRRILVSAAKCRDITAFFRPT